LCLPIRFWHEVRTTGASPLVTLGVMPGEMQFVPPIGAKSADGSVGGPGKGPPGWDRCVVALAVGQHGVVSRRQLLGLGMGRRAIAGRLERGFLQVVHNGVYAVGAVPLAQEARWTAALLACGWDGQIGEGAPVAVLSHRSAARLWGLVRTAPALSEVITPSGRRGGRRGILTRCLSLREDEIEIVRGIAVTSVARAIFDFAAVARDQRELERAWNEMEVRRLTSRVSVPQLLERYPGRPGAPALRALLGSGEPGGVTRNDFEEAFVALIDAHGLPRPRLNADLWLRGRFVEVDCLWSRQRVALELDGRAVHARRAAFESDKKRDRELLVEGWRPARVTWMQLRDEPGAVVADLRELLAGPTAGADASALAGAGSAVTAYP
jgi:very-short-patch-repair endonuclease